MSFLKNPKARRALITQVLEMPGYEDARGRMDWRRLAKEHPDIGDKLGLDDARLTGLTSAMTQTIRREKGKVKVKRGRPPNAPVVAAASPNGEPQIEALPFCPHCGFSLAVYALAYNVAQRRGRG